MSSSCKTSRFINAIDHSTERLGQGVCWLALFIMLFQCAAVLLNLLTINAMAFQEAAMYSSACLFMLSIGFALKNEQHVRVDIFYRRFTPFNQAWVNVIGALVFTLPLAVFIFFSSQYFVAQSWGLFEISSEPGGLPAVFLLKTLIPLLAITLALQAIAEIFRNLQQLMSATANDTNDSSDKESSEASS